MKGPARKAFVLVIGATVMLIGGCGGQQEPPNVKKSRVIAAENMELRKQLEQRSKEIETLKERNSEEIKKQEELLAACQQEKETWKKKAQQNIRDQVKGVLDPVMEEISKLREENKRLQAQIEELQKQTAPGNSTEK
jgi:DNA repair exonuclease SbcCD ATPase subunit